MAERGQAVIRIVRRVVDLRFARYLLASVGALAIDMACFLALLSAGVGAMAASAIGYALGIVTHWMLSSRAVFTDRVAQRGAQRTWQKALFVGSALLGLAVTTAIVGAGDAAGMDARVAKCISIAASFVLTWLIRRHVVFAGRSDATRA